MTEAFFLHIIIIIIVSLIISYFISKFYQLPVDIFNASNGLLLAFLFTFSTIQKLSTQDATMDQSITIVLLMAQFSIGIMVIVAYLAFKNYKNENSENAWLSLFKISLSYSFSLILSLTSYYIVSILYVYKNSIFVVNPNVKGGLSKIINNVWQFNKINFSDLVIIILVIYVVSLFFFCRDQFRSIFSQQ